jgi:hypothetical protein
MSKGRKSGEYVSEKWKGRRETESVDGIVKIRTGKPVLSGSRGRKNIENEFPD